MTTEAETTEPTETGEQPANTEGEKTFTQADVDRIIAQRLNREGIDALRDKAAKLDEIEQASKSETDKLREQLDTATRERDEATRQVTRARIAAEYGIGDLADTIAGGDEDEMRTNAERIAEKVKATPKPGANPHTSAAARASDSGGDPKELAAAALRGLGR